MARHLEAPLLGRYRLERVSPAAWEQSFEQVKPEVFPGDAHLDLARAWGEERVHRMAALNGLLGEPLRLDLLIRDPEQGDAVVGWGWGEQDMRATWYMAVTAVHPAWRGRGIYSAYLERVLDLTGELGFREVLSRHQANNNPVLIAKLRAGFQIAAFEMAPNYGFLVHLRYNFSEAMRRVYAWRVDARVGAGALIRDGILKREEVP